MSLVNNKKDLPDQKNSVNEEVLKNMEKINETKEVEKQFLEGEMHKDILENQIAPNLTENNKVEKIIFPKKNYLNDKMSNMNINKNILTGINMSMDKQMKNIETDIIQNQILMTEVPKSLSNILSKSLEKSSNFEKRSQLKIIRELQGEKYQLKIKLQKIITNEKFLEKEGFMHDSVGEVPDKNFSVVDQKIYENKKKIINEKKKEILDRIDQIEEKINQIISNAEGGTRKERVKNYIENFERDKEIIETRAKKYFKENKERKQRMANDLNQKIEKLQQEIKDKCKEEELKKAEIIKKFKEKEKAIVQKRTKINDDKANLFKPYLKKNPKNNIKQYLFAKKEEEFQQEEKNLVDKENLKRKAKMKMDFDEINEFEKNVINNREKFETQNAERKKKLVLEWKERKGILPTYISRKQEMVQEELKNKMEDEENKKEINLALLEKKHSYGYDLVKNQQPEINKKLKQQRTELIKSLENPKLAVKEKLFLQRQKKAEELLNEKKNNLNSKSVKKVRIKKENESFNKLSDSIILKEKKEKEKKKLFSFARPSYPLHPKPETKIDYLNELRIEKNKNRNSFSGGKNNNGENKRTMEKKWNKALNREEGTVMENIMYVKEKAKVMDNEVKHGEKIIELYGGVQNNPEMGKKISNLLIDSIEAKLSILNKFSEE